MAREWGVPPYVVDEAPRGEVLLALQLMELESETPGPPPPADDDDDA